MHLWGPLKEGHPEQQLESDWIRWQLEQTEGQSSEIKERHQDPFGKDFAAFSIRESGLCKRDEKLLEPGIKTREKKSLPRSPGFPESIVVIPNVLFVEAMLHPVDKWKKTFKVLNEKNLKKIIGH
ncbi:hypothetical protein DUI87_17623 [Hirundo rustica rustica]|uniref:Uncharacterized protein n=1 Tax=Hirundo rustica rustica TaxID=333673 RepID=A0A3M0JZA4_HIRRU|nr:hypothetical protein DUI87_17623 [Hirundo rustica rustica]